MVLVDVRCCCSIFPINALHFIKGARVQWFNFLKFLLLTVKSQNLERGPGAVPWSGVRDRKRRSKRRNVYDPTGC